jgi:hypothetical protein
MKSTLTFPLLVVIALLTASAQQPSKGSAQTLEQLQAAKKKKKADTEEAVSKLREKLAPALALTVQELELALRVKVQLAYSGARVVADDRRHSFLGVIDDEFAIDSIFNEFGQHGSKYALMSIWNEYGEYGSQYAIESAMNPYSTSPPLILKQGKVIGRLTVNRYVAGAVDPNWLRTYFRY